MSAISPLPTQSIPDTWAQLRNIEQVALEGPLHEVSRLFAVAGADAARARLHRIDSLPRLLDADDSWVDKDPAAAMHAAHHVTLLRCLDVPLPERAEGAEARWMRRVAHPRQSLCESMRRTMALNALVVGEQELIPELVAGGRLRRRARPRPIHGPNVSGFIRLLAEAIAGDHDRSAIDESWRSFLRWFPLSLASDGATWVDLVLAAAVVAVRFDRQPIASVASSLPALVDGLV